MINHVNNPGILPCLLSMCPNKCDAPCLSGGDFDANWIGRESDIDQDQLKLLHSALGIMIKVASANVTMPTVTAWDVMEPVFNKVVVAAKQLNRMLSIGCSEAEAAPSMLMPCKQQLWQLLHVMLAERLIDEKIDVSRALNLILLTAIQDRHFASTPPGPTGTVALALLKRAGEDKAVLSDQVGTLEEREVKANNVAALWVVLCKFANSSDFVS